MACVLLNAHARGGRAAALAAPMAAWLQGRGVPLFVSDSIAAARAHLATRPRGERVVLVGGDGTLHQLLPALLAGGHELGLVPHGSGDDSARALGLRGLRWPEALAFALDAPARAVDIGLLRTEHGEQPFFSSVNAGFDAAVAQRALAAPRWLRGLPRYLLATLQELLHLQLHSLRLDADGQPVHDGPALFVSALNTPSYGGGMPAVPGARIDDGRLDLLLAGRFGRVGTLAMLPRLLIGQHLGHREVRCQPFTALQIQSERPLPLAADGEPVASAQQVQIRVHSAKLAVVRRAA